MSERDRVFTIASKAGSRMYTSIMKTRTDIETHRERAGREQTWKKLVRNVHKNKNRLVYREAALTMTVTPSLSV